MRGETYKTYIQAKPYEDTTDYPDPAMEPNGVVDAIFMFGWIVVFIVLFVGIISVNWFKK